MAVGFLRVVMILSLSAVSSMASQASAHQQPTSRAECGAWRLVTSPPHRGYLDELSSVAPVSATDVWAVGITARKAGRGAVRPLIEHWNGVRWRIVEGARAAGLGYSLSSVSAVSANDVWAVGESPSYPYTLLEHWNGVRWSTVAAPHIREYHGNAVLEDVDTISTSDAWTVGFTGSQAVTEHWNGGMWTGVPSSNPVRWHAGPMEGHNFLYGVSGSSPSNAWAVGDFWFHFGRPKLLLEHWNGIRWTLTRLARGRADTQVLAGVSSLSNADAWIVGGQTIGTGSLRRNEALVERWNGARWVAMDPKAHGLASVSGLGSVAALGPNNVWAAGTAGYAGQPASSGDLVFVHWDGHVWHISRPPSGIPSTAQYSGVEGIGNNLWTVGFSGVKGQQTALILQRTGC